MAKRPRAPESDCQRLQRAARDGDRAALLPLSDAYEEAGDAESAGVARGLSELLARWHRHVDPEEDGEGPREGQRPLLVSVLISADGSWSFAALRAIRTGRTARARAVSLTPSRVPEPALAKLLERFGQLHDLVECIGRSLGLPAVLLGKGTAGETFEVTLGDGQHLAPLGGAPVTSIRFGP